MTENNSYTYHTITLPDNTDLAYIDIGTGEQTIIFLHGIGNIAYVWHKNIDMLSKDFRCIAIDFPGNGFSTLTDTTYSLGYFADSVAYLIQQLNLQKVHLTGHSMGGQTALVFALKYPDLLQSLILCAPAGFESFNSWEAKLFEVMMTFVDVQHKRDHFKNAINLSFYNKPNDIDLLIDATVESLQGKNEKYYKSMLEQCVRSMVNDKISDKLSDIKIRTLILFGLNDNYIPIKAIHPLNSTKSIAQKGAIQFPNAQLILLENCGHTLQWEKADVVNDAIMKFIKNRK